MEKEYMTHAWELPDIDMLRINDERIDEYKEEVKWVKNYNLNNIINSAKLYDEKIGDRDKPRKWFLIGSYFFYKISRYSNYADEYHLTLGTYCFLQSLRCREDGKNYYNYDLSTMSAGRLLFFWLLFDRKLFRNFILRIAKHIYPNSKSSDEDLYVNANVQIHNALSYKFSCHINSIINTYHEYLSKDEYDYIEFCSKGVGILFDHNYEARNEIIERYSKYLDTLWDEILNSPIVRKNVH